MSQTPSPAGRLRGQHHGAVSSSKLSPALGGVCRGHPGVPCSHLLLIWAGRVPLWGQCAPGRKWGHHCLLGWALRGGNGQPHGHVPPGASAHLCLHPGHGWSDWKMVRSLGVRPNLSLGNIQRAVVHLSPNHTQSSPPHSSSC